MLFLSTTVEVVTVVYNNCKFALEITHLEITHKKTSFHIHKAYIATMNELFANQTKFRCNAREVHS